MLQMKTGKKNPTKVRKVLVWLFRKKKFEGGSSLGAQSWMRFRKDKLAFSALLFVIFIALAATFGYFLSPDHSPLVNEQNLLIATRKPGFSVYALLVPKNQEIEKRGFIGKLLFGQESQYLAIPVSSTHFSGDSIVVQEYSAENEGKRLAFHLFGVVCPPTSAQLAVKNGNSCTFITMDGKRQTLTTEELRIFVEDRHLVVKKFPLGTDRYGRDVLSQLIIGARVSLSVGFISVAISLLIGIFLGAIAGYFGGVVDAIISWFINVVWAVPTLLLVIAVTFAIGKGFWQVFVAVGLTMWVEVARVVRGQFLSLREKEFVEAARALGFRNFRIIFRHILPNAMAPVIVISAANFASAILLEAGLSFLGIGVQPPMPSWGSMIKENYAYIILNYAYLAILPGVAIMVMVLAFMLIGNGLRDALDVRTAVTR
jgi:peptide/nickel transport system permease protein